MKIKCQSACSVYVWQILFDVQLEIQSVMWRFLKWKWKSNDTYIFFVKCHLNVTCLVVFLKCLDVWSFLPTSHTTCQNLKCACQLTCLLCLCKFLHVKCCKNFVKKIHTECMWWKVLVASDCFSPLDLDCSSTNSSMECSCMNGKLVGTWNITRILYCVHAATLNRQSWWEM